MAKTLGVKRKRSDDSGRPGRSKRVKSVTRVVSMSNTVAQVRVPRNILGDLTRSCTLVYSDWVSMDYAATGTTVGTAKYKANGMFDPQVSVGGHQPRGFDQLMALFDRFVVTGVKAEMWFNPSPASGRAAIGGIAYVEDVSTPPSTVTDFMECANGVVSTNAVNPGSQLGTYVTSYWDLVKLKGNGKNRREYINTAEYQGSDGADPADTCQLIFWTGDTQETTTGTSYSRVRMRITYYATFLQARSPASS